MKRLWMALVCALLLAVLLTAPALAVHDATENRRYEDFNDPPTYTVTLSANPSAGGAVGGGGSYSDGNQVTITATAFTGYRFDHWKRDDGTTLQDAAFSFAIHENRSYEAVFVENTVIYTVTLDPGLGTGEPITFSTKNGISTESCQTVGNCQFYYEDDGSLAFRLKDEYCPGTFARPTAFYAFDGWEGNVQYNKLTAEQTTFTAKWLLDWDAGPDASHKLSFQPVTLQGPGYTPFTIMAETLVLGKYVQENGNYAVAEQLGVNLFLGELSDGNGNSLSCIPCHADQTYDPEWPTMETITSQGQKLDLFIYLDPESFEAAIPGTYTGALGINVSWKAGGIGFNADYTIPLTLVVPEHPHIIKTDGAALAYYYDDSFEKVFPTEAEEGTELSLWLREDAEPEEGNYFTGEFTVNGVSLGRKTSVDGLISWPVTGFTMPREDVTIGAVQAAREAMALSFAPNQTLALPRDAWMQIQFMEGEPPLIWYDEATATQALDVNRDRKPDLLIAFDDEAYCVNLTRLPACAAFGEFAFAFSGPKDRYGTVAFVIPKPTFGPAAFTLPANLATIGESAFEGMTAMTVVDAGHVTAIGANAFRGCTALTQLLLPAACKIDVTAFTGCDTVFIFAPAGGTTEASCAAIANVVFVPAD